MLKPRRCNNTVDLTTSVVNGLKCFNLVLKWNYDTISNLVWSRGDPALLTTPLTWKLNMYVKYSFQSCHLLILQDLCLSPMWVTCVSWVSPICVLGKSHVSQYSISWVPCVSQNYLSDAHALGMSLTYLDMWVPCGHRFVNCGHGCLLCPGTPSSWVPKALN